jgi:hypothetical protein
VTTPALAQNVKGKGRHYQGADGELVPSVTNIIGIMDKPALPRWAANEVAKRAAALKRSLGAMSDADVVDTLKGAPWAKSSRAADRGTDIHEYLEYRLKRWEAPELSEDALPFKDAADDWFDRVGASLEDVRTEQTLFHPAYAGTCDVVARSEAGWLLADFKTSKAIYDEAALQLTALAGCLTDAEGGRVPWRDDDMLTDFAWPELVVIRIGEDGWEEKRVADPDGCYEAFFGLLAAWRWKHGKAYA